MDKSDFLFKTLLINLKYRVSKEMLQRFMSDPDNLVLSFTNTLDYFDIKYVAAYVPKTALEQLPKYFIAQVSNGKTEHLVIVSKESDNKLKIQVSEQKKISLNKAQFLHDWTGFLIALEEKQAEAKYISKKHIIYGSLVLFTLMIVLFIGLTTSSVLSLAFFTLSLLGIGLSYLLIREKFGQKTIASKYCKISNTTSCENVLNSKGSHVTKYIDLTDIVVVYFIFLSSSF